MWPICAPSSFEKTVIMASSSESLLCTAIASSYVGLFAREPSFGAAGGPLIAFLGGRRDCDHERGFRESDRDYGAPSRCGNALPPGGAGVGDRCELGISWSRAEYEQHAT